MILKQWAYGTAWVAHRPSGDKWGARCSRWWARSWARSSNPPSRLWCKKKKHACSIRRQKCEFVTISNRFSSSSITLWTEDWGHTFKVRSGEWVSPDFSGNKECWSGQNSSVNSQGPKGVLLSATSVPSGSSPFLIHYLDVELLCTESGMHVLPISKGSTH